MTQDSAVPVLRVGFQGSGFIADFHLQAMLGVRNVRIAAVYSPTAAHRDAFAQKVDAAGLGPCQANKAL